MMCSIVNSQISPVLCRAFFSAFFFASSLLQWKRIVNCPAFWPHREKAPGADRRGPHSPHTRAVCHMKGCPPACLFATPFLLWGMACTLAPIFHFRHFCRKKEGARSGSASPVFSRSPHPAAVPLHRCGVSALHIMPGGFRFSAFHNSSAY